MVIELSFTLRVSSSRVIRPFPHDSFLITKNKTFVKTLIFHRNIFSCILVHETFLKKMVSALRAVACNKFFVWLPRPFVSCSPNASSFCGATYFSCWLVPYTSKELCEGEHCFSISEPSAKLYNANLQCQTDLITIILLLFIKYTDEIIMISTNKNVLNFTLMSHQF